jgi:hypothetical protein
MARGDEVAGHGEAHGAEADESQLHEDLRFSIDHKLAERARFIWAS